MTFIFEIKFTYSEIDKYWLYIWHSSMLTFISSLFFFIDE